MMSRKPLCSTLAFLSVSVFCFGEIIPAARRTTWSPGIPGGIPSRTNIFADVTAAPYNAAGDGITDDTAALQQAINDCPDNQVVYLPTGTYLTTSELNIGGEIVLRGDGPSLSKILMDTDLTADIIGITGPSGSDSPINITSGYTKDSTNIVVADASTISVGDYIGVYQDNDTSVVSIDQPGGQQPTCSYCGFKSNSTHTMCQIVEVAGKSGNSLDLSRPLFFTFKVGLDPEIEKIRMIENVGIEDLYIEQVSALASGADNANNIQLNRVAKSWIKNVESTMPIGAHIRARRCFAVEVRECYLHEGHYYSSGRNYGVFLFGINTDWLVEDNIIELTRHSIVMEGGGNGNVFGYNYTKDPFESPNALWLSGDLLTHGAHPYMNLYEGNYSANIRADYVHGSASHNTYFRNLSSMVRSVPTTQGQDAVDLEERNYYHNVVGNVLGDAALTSATLGPEAICSTRPVIWRFGCRAPGGGGVPPSDTNSLNTVIRHGNYDYVTDTTIWDPEIEDQVLPDSLYLAEKPAFFGGLNWPIIGPDLDPIVAEIPAVVRRGGGEIPPPEMPSEWWRTWSPPEGLKIQ